jgi:precorrin-6A synthase
MRRIRVIGIGAGDPEHLTLGAIRALNETDVVFIVTKGGPTEEMHGFRVELCRRFIEPSHPYRIVDVPDTERDRTAPAYAQAVDEWRGERIVRYEELIAGLGEAETGAFLVWGDPAIYDGTIVVLDRILDRGRVTFAYDVIPGISSVSALAARHRVPLNHTGEAIHITPGRRLARHGLPDGVDNVVVVLDSQQAWRDVDEDVDIFWGAFVGTADEILVSGRLADVRTTIERRRDEARARMGWMFDTYLLRRRTKS